MIKLYVGRLIKSFFLFISGLIVCNKLDGKSEIRSTIIVNDAESRTSLTVLSRTGKHECKISSNLINRFRDITVY